MTVFGNYARYYNLLYRDKDYESEAKFVCQLLQTEAPETRSLLELGCGTGVHAAILAKLGYEVYGVDLSVDMLAEAKKRSQNLPATLASKLKFAQGDIRTVRLGQKFDAIISLFHVFSYQTTNHDLQAAFATAKAHLKPGGLLIFDCWYGPGVLSDRPTVRVKRLEDAEITVTRIAEPVIHLNDNLVDVNYQVFIKNRATSQVEELQETHKMRYLFKPEIDYLFSAHEFEFMNYGEWMTGNQPSNNTWNVYFIGKLRG
jgi:SAM-dependent methyltransferase